MKFEFLSYESDINKVKDLIKDVFNIDDIKNIEIVDNPRFLILKKDDNVIAASMLTTKYDPIKDVKIMYVDYVCVDKLYQHQGYGTKLFSEIENVARNEKYNYIELTSNKKREHARAIYLKQGMEIIDTDVFIKKID